MTSRKVLSMNANGLKSKGRLNSFLREMGKHRMDVLLVQETGLAYADEVWARGVAREAGYLIFFGFRPRDEGRGGTAVLVRMDTFDLHAFSTLQHQSHLGGRVVVVTIPDPTLSNPDATLKVASMYVPVHSALRGAFLRRLRKQNPFDSRTYVGMDANCVADPRIDVSYPEHSYTVYSNTHAPALENLMASTGLHDAFRFMNGNTPSYTRACATVHTRIDRLFSPAVQTDHEWTHVRVDASLGKAGWKSDHRAIVGTLAHTGSPEPPPRRVTIDPTIYETSEAQFAVAAMKEAVYATYPPDTYGHANTHDYFKSSALATLAKLSSLRSPTLGKQTFLKTVLDRHIRLSSKAGVSAAATARTALIQNALQEEKEKYKGARGLRARTFVEMEERGEKAFYKRYKPRRSTRGITSLYKVEGTTPTPSDPTRDPKLMTAYASTYFKNLMSIKPSEPAAKLTCLEKLRECRLSKESSDSCEGAISRAEVVKSIRSMSRGKQCGPDGLHSDFWYWNENLLADQLTGVFNEMHSDGALGDTFRQGHISLLYKKKDPNDIRNYRPITLLNTDYKILTKILVARMNEVMDEIISEPQKGFAPKRVIQENTHLTNLIQAYLDETDEEGIFLFLDMEKAFDRVSHEYLRDAVEALGFGQYLCRWVDTLYSDERPAQRRVAVNGHCGDYFPIRAGTAQGCPLSPLLFIIVSEALTRLIQSDPDYEGIQVGDTRHDISQFADDTVLFLTGTPSSIRKAMAHVSTYCDATGQSVNHTKTEGLPVGASRRQALPEYAGIAWCADGDYITSLGVPIGNNFDERAFWLTKYYKAKSLMAQWYQAQSLTLTGRAMVANAMVYSRFRYLAQSINMPKDISQALESDVQAFVWNKELSFDPDKVGTPLTSRRWMAEGAQYLPRKQGGLSLPHWPSHVKALRAVWWPRYCDGTQSAWKQVLDEWIAHRFKEDRGAIFTTIPATTLLTPLSHRRGAIPKFFTTGLRDFKSLTITPSNPFLPYLSKEEALAEPVWTGHRISLRNRSHLKVWRGVGTAPGELHFDRLSDAVVEGTDRLWTSPEVHAQLTQSITALTGEGKKFFRWPADVGSKNEITVEGMLDEWDSFIRDIGYETLFSATQQPKEWEQFSYSPAARRIMGLQGWIHGPLTSRTGTTLQPPSHMGRTFNHDSKRSRKPGEPVLFVQANEGKNVMYGDTNHTKPTPNPFFTTVHVFESQLGYPVEKDGKYYLRLIRITPTGKLVTTGERTGAGDPTDFKKAVSWRSPGGYTPVGVAEDTYPHPGSWTVVNLLTPAPIDRLTVRLLTTAFSAYATERPRAEARWEGLLGSIPWPLVWRRFSNPLLTPKDTKNAMRIAHRSLYSKREEVCRLCKQGRDRLSHLASCPVLAPLFASFDETLSPLLIYLGLRADRSALKGGNEALHCILWKFILIHYTRVSMEGVPFSSAAVGEQALRRFLVRLEAYASTVQRDIRQATQRDNAPADKIAAILKRANRAVAPMAGFTPRGRLLLDHVLREDGIMVGTYTSANVPPPLDTCLPCADQQEPRPHTAEPHDYPPLWAQRPCGEADDRFVRWALNRERTRHNEWRVRNRKMALKHRRQAKGA
jgi:exonuclease III